MAHLWRNFRTSKSTPRERPEEFEAFLNSEKPEAHQDSVVFKTSIPYVLSIFFGATTLLLSLAIVFQKPGTVFFPTDLHNARSAVEYEQRVFTKTISFDTSLKHFLRTNGSETQYFGDPSPEIETAWNDLLRGNVSSKTLA